MLLKVVQLAQMILKQLFLKYILIQGQFKFMVVKIMTFHFMVEYIFQLFQQLGSITAAAKKQIVADLKKSFTIASVTPVIVDPEYTDIRLNVVFQYNAKNTTKQKKH